MPLNQIIFLGVDVEVDPISLLWAWLVDAATAAAAGAAMYLLLLGGPLALPTAAVAAVGAFAASTVFLRGWSGQSVGDRFGEVEYVRRDDGSPAGAWRMLVWDVAYVAVWPLPGFLAELVVDAVGPRALGFAIVRA